MTPWPLRMRHPPQAPRPRPAKRRSNGCPPCSRDGPVPSGELRNPAPGSVRALAKEADLSWATIRRAADKLGIRRERERFSKVWVWRLPDGRVAQDRLPPTPDNLSNSGFEPETQVAQQVEQVAQVLPVMNNLSNMSNLTQVLANKEEKINSNISPARDVAQVAQVISLREQPAQVDLFGPDDDDGPEGGGG